MSDQGMTGSLSIRPAAVEERGALEALQLRASLVWDEYRGALLASPDAIELPTAHIRDGRTLLAELGQALAGFAVVLPRSDGDAELDGLFVEPSLWRKGVGTHLIQAAEVLAADRGANFLHVIANPHARDFYVARGFILIGEVATRFGIGLRMHKVIGSAA